jgi:hypothetical protein
MTEKLGMCSKCDRRWGGDRQAHCPTCCAHFGSLRAFDLHLGPLPASGPQSCRDPARLRRRDGTPKLVDHDGVWLEPARKSEWAAATRQRGSGRRAAAQTSPDESGVGEAS